MFPRHLNKYTIIYMLYVKRIYCLYVFQRYVMFPQGIYILLFEILYSIPEFLKYPNSNCVLNGI